jgi:hypothetical protein
MLHELLFIINKLHHLIYDIDFWNLLYKHFFIHLALYYVQYPLFNDALYKMWLLPVEQVFNELK